MKLGSFFSDFRILCLIASIFSTYSFGQTLIINEMSNGPSGSQEYVEFLVVDNTVTFDCNTSTPPCIDIRGWIFDDNSGFHGTNGIAAGAGRFSFDPLWSCVPVGTLILVYNNLDPNVNLPTIDLLLNDGNCRIVAPFNNSNLFESNMTTPGAVACSYPVTGWAPGGNWTFTSLNNAGDCARIVDLSGCEVFSVCYGSCNTNNLIYFAGNGGQKCYFFNGGNPLFNFNWSQGTAAAGGGDETPGFPNNAANAAYIAQFNNGCTPITPLVANVNSTNTNCGCTGTASATASGSIPGYTYNWTDELFAPIGQTTATASNLCSGTYNVIVGSSIGCFDTLQVVINDIGNVTNSNQNIAVCANSTYTFPDGSSAVISSNTTQTSILTSSIGCDSIINTTITLLQPFTSTNTISSCANSIITFPDGSSQTVTANITQVSNLIASNGCDSIITTNVTVSTAIQTIQNSSICNNTSYTFPDGSTSIITTNTTQLSTLLASNGCDSIVTTNLTVLINPQVQLSVGVCQGDNVLLPDGSTQNNVQSNFSFNDTYLATNGCDSTVTINYQVNTPTSTIQNVTVCSGQSVTFPDGTSQTNVIANTTYTSNLISTAGCDSTITTNVSVQTSVTTSQSVDVCLGSTFTYPDGVSEVIIGNTTHISNLISQFGCDSIVTTNLTALSNSTTPQFDTICMGTSYSFPDGSTMATVNQNIIYNSVFNNTNGCDSIIETHLHVLPIPNANFTFSPVSPTSLDNEVTFTPNNLSEFSYLWTIQDANNIEILTSTDTILAFVFEPNFISPFLICLNTTSSNLCESTSCQTVVINAEISVFIPNAFSPNNDLMNDSFSPVISSDLFEDYEFTIFDRWGLIVFSSTTYPESWDGNYRGEYAPIDTYTYKIYFKEKNSVNEFKFTGHVSIVR
jgi:gliding motility-associated-like protein